MLLLTASNLLVCFHFWAEKLIFWSVPNLFIMYSINRGGSGYRIHLISILFKWMSFPLADNLTSHVGPGRVTVIVRNFSPKGFLRPCLLLHAALFSPPASNLPSIPWEDCPDKFHGKVRTHVKKLLSKLWRFFFSVYVLYILEKIKQKIRKS